MSQAVKTTEAPRAAPAETPTGTLSLTRDQTRLAWAMLLPTLAVVAFIALYPLLQTIWQSFTDARLASGVAPKFVGLDNYQRLLSDTQFRNSIFVTVQFTALTLVFEFILGLVIAMVINSNFKGRGLMRAAMLVPWAIPTVISAQMWKWMYNDVYGVVNDLLVKLHILSHNIAFLADPNLAIPSIAAVDIWKTTPYVALLLLAGLQVIPSDVYEAARVDGASAIQQFIKITLPLLRPAITVTLIFRTLDALRVFDVFFVMFGATKNTQTLAIYDQQTIVSFSRLGYGATISIGIFVIIGIFVVAYATFLRVEQS